MYMDGGPRRFAKINQPDSVSPTEEYNNAKFDGILYCKRSKIKPFFVDVISALYLPCLK